MIFFIILPPGRKWCSCPIRGKLEGPGISRHGFKTSSFVFSIAVFAAIDL